MSLAFRLSNYGLSILPQNRNRSEPILIRRRLRLLYPLLQLLRSQIPLPSLRYDEPERYEIVRIRQRAQIIPILLVKLRQGRQDQNRLPIPNRICGCCHVVHHIVHHWRRWRDFIWTQLRGFPEGQGGW